MDDLTDDERQTLIDLIDEAIRDSHFPLSPRSEKFRTIREKLRGAIPLQAPNDRPGVRKHRGAG